MLGLPMEVLGLLMGVLCPLMKVFGPVFFLSLASLRIWVLLRQVWGLLLKLLGHRRSLVLSLCREFGKSQKGRGTDGDGVVASGVNPSSWRTLTHAHQLHARICYDLFNRREGD